jgi:hypothetical protein
MIYGDKRETKRDAVSWGINRVEFLPDTILALKQVLEEVWDRGYRYAQTEIAPNPTSQTPMISL